MDGLIENVVHRWNIVTKHLNFIPVQAAYFLKSFSYFGIKTTTNSMGEKIQRMYNHHMKGDCENLERNLIKFYYERRKTFQNRRQTHWIPSDRRCCPFDKLYIRFLALRNTTAQFFIKHFPSWHVQLEERCRHKSVNF